MIIKGIHIDGFGIFNNFSIRNLGNGLNLVLGDNEAGKSTLLKFLRFTLFGYPRLHDQRMPPLQGGSHGGRVEAILSSGKKVTFERSGNDKIMLHHEGQTSQNQSQWSQLLGNASASLYNNVYAISLDELVDLGSLSESGVEDKIFSVGLGLGDLSIGKVEQDIRGRMEKIYITRGKNQEVPGILHKMKEKQKMIGTIQANLQAYEAFLEEKQALQSTLEDNGRQIEKIKNKKATIESYIACYDAFVDYTDAEDRLEKLPEEQDYPDQATAQLEQLERQEEEQKETIDALMKGSGEEEGIARLKQVLESIVVNTSLLSKKGDVQTIRNDLSLYKQTIKEIQDDKERYSRMNNSISETLNTIGSGWAEQDVLGFSDQVRHTDFVSRYRKEMELTERSKAETEASLKASRIREGVIHTNRFANTVSIILCIGGLSAIYYGLTVLAGSLFLSALVLFTGKRYFTRSSNIDLLASQADKLGRKQDSLRQQYNTYLEEELGLSAPMSAEAVLDIIQKIVQLRKDISERDELKIKIDSKQLHVIKALDDKVAEIVNDLSFDWSAEKANTETLANAILKEYDQSEEMLRQKKQLETELSRKERMVVDKQEKLEEVKVKINQLLGAARTTDREVFRQKIRTNDEVKALKQKKRDALVVIEQIAGKDKSQEVIGYLRNNEKVATELTIDELHNLLREKGTESAAISERLGELKNELNRMENESDLAGVMTALEVDRQRLAQAYKEWMAGYVALSILTGVRSRYELEKQPEVIKRASFYFNRITGGRYSRIQVSLDDKEVTVFDHRKASKKTGQLSRGTREQLLISLRLGFIEEYERQSEPLPLIVDEVLVNFDTERSKKAAEILMEFARDRQILVFSCRPETAGLFPGSKVNLTELNQNL